MNLTLHLIRKDLRALRLGFLLWAIFCLNHLFLRLVQYFYGETFLPAKFSFTDRPDHQILIYFPILLIPWLLHQDPLRGNLSFWKTIPVSRSRLATAKTVLLLTFFVLLPLACETAYFTTAGLTRILPAALGDWAVRELPAIAVITLASAFTRTIWVGLIAAAVGFTLIPQRITRYFESQPSPLSPPREHPVPKGVTLKVLDSNRKAYVYLVGHGQPDGKIKNLKHVTTSFQFQVSNLPDGIVMDTPYGQDLRYELNGKTHELKTFGNSSRSVIPIGDQDQPIARKSGASKPDRQSFGWSFNMDHILERETAVIPIKGIIKVPLYRRITLKTGALAEGEFTRDGYNSLSLESFTLNQDQVKGDFLQRNLMLDGTKPDGTPYYHPFQTYCLWFRAPEYDLSFRESYIARNKYSNYDLQRPGWTVSPIVSLDKTRQLECYTFQFDTSKRRTNETSSRSSLKETILGDFKTIKPVLSSAQWNISLITYEKSGEVSLPVEIVFEVISPYVQTDDALAYNPDAPALNEETVYSQTEKVLTGPVMDRQTARTWLNRLAETITNKPNSYSTSSREFALENKFRHALLKVGNENADLLFSFLLRSKEINRNHNGSIYFTPNASASTKYRNVTSPNAYRYIFPVEHIFLESSLLLNPDQKEFYLEQLTPQMDLLEQMIIFEWDREALPKIIAYANQEGVPLSWQKYLLENPGEETNQALANQIKRGVAPFWLTGKFLEKHPELARDVAEGLWEHLCLHTDDLGALSRVFAIAACHGVASVPTDLREILSMESEKLDGGYFTSTKDKTKVIDLQLSMIQSLALCSECPMTYKEGSAWVRENADKLKFNNATKRYELPLTTTSETPQTWGRWVNPIGNGKAVQKDGGIILTAAGSATNWLTPVDSERSLPRILREVEGDFTLEADIAPSLNPFGLPRYDNNRWQAVGLFLFGDDTRQMFLEQGAGGKDRPILNSSSLRGGKNFGQVISNSNWKPDQPTRLKLARKGNLFIRAWKQGAGGWQGNSVEMLEGWPRKSQVGFFACNIISTPLTCHFGNITLTSSAEVPDVPVLPPLTQWKGTPTATGTDLPGWGTVENPVQAGEFKISEGSLTLEVAPRHCDFNFHNNLYAPRALTTVKGDFTYEVTVESLDYQQHVWTSADVLAVDEATNHYLRGNVASPSGDAKTPMLFSTLYGASGVAQPFMGTEHLPIDRTKPTRIRLQRKGPYFHLSFRQEGGEWFEFFPKAAPTWPDEIKVGVMVLNESDDKNKGAPVTAVFSNPKLTMP